MTNLERIAPRLARAHTQRRDELAIEAWNAAARRHNDRPIVHNPYWEPPSFAEILFNTSAPRLPRSLDSEATR